MSIRGTYRNGQVVLNQPTDWPNETSVDVVPFMESDFEDIVGMQEDQPGDDPAVVARWIKEFHAIPALSWSEAEIRRLQEWQDRMKAFNVEAVRKEFVNGASK